MSRIQLALNVEDLDQSVAFYSKLFGTEPAKLRPGYANFAIAEPPLKLILIENPGQGGSLNHLGVEVADTETVDAEQTRLAEAGLASIDERDTTCCYARQDKFWVTGHPAANAGRSTPSRPTAPPSGARPAARAGTRPKPSWTPARERPHPRAPAAPQRPSAQPPSLRQPDQRTREHGPAPAAALCAGAGSAGREGSAVPAPGAGR